MFTENAIGLRAPAAETEPTLSNGDVVMFGHFTPFNQWTEINSWYEGHFLERIAPGSFAKTIQQNRAVTQFDHGYDVFVGSSVLGPIRTLREEDFGPYYEVPLLDTDYNRDRIVPMLQGRTMSGTSHGSLLGASFRFRVIRDEWNEEPDPSEDNPTGLPERTIREVRLYEFGPVVFPAYPQATAQASTAVDGPCRSLTDYYLDRLRSIRSRDTGDSAISLGRTETTTPDAPPTLAPEERGMSLLMAQAILDTLR